ncbi:hypothetical protein ACI6Q2_06815 [Chitinophagaceae bacterium LWZ2-11]
MNRILLSTFSLIGLLNFAGAQKVKVNWGEESKTELEYKSFVNGSGTDMIKLCFENKYTVLGAKKSITPTLVRYDEKLAEKNAKKFEVDDKNIKFDNLLSIKGRLYMFTNQYDPSSKITGFYCQPINITTLALEGTPINLGSFDAINKSTQSSVGYEISKDSSKILMFGLAPSSKKDNEKYYMGVYDYNMNKLWGRTVELPYKDKFIEVLGQLVTNEGKVGVIIKHYDQEVSKESILKDGSRSPSYKTKFLVYEDESTNPAEYELNLNNKFVHAIQVTDESNDNLVLFGLYKEKYNGYVSGFFINSISKITKEVLTKKMEAFPATLIEQIKIDKQGSDKEKDPGLASEFKLTEVVTRNDSSRDYILEYYKATLKQHITSRPGQFDYRNESYWEYNYGDIIDVNIKPAGSVVITRIPKMQNSKNIQIYSSFKAMPYKNKLLLFYNDTDGNIDRDLSKKPDDFHNFQKSVFSMAVVDAKGNLTRSILSDYKDTKLITAIKECKRIDNKRLGLYAQKLQGFFSWGRDMVGILQVD